LGGGRSAQGVAQALPALDHGSPHRCGVSQSPLCLGAPARGPPARSWAGAPGRARDPPAVSFGAGAPARGAASPQRVRRRDCGSARAAPACRLARGALPPCPQLSARASRRPDPARRSEASWRRPCCGTCFGPPSTRAARAPRVLSRGRLASATPSGWRVGTARARPSRQGVSVELVAARRSL